MKGGCGGEGCEGCEHTNTSEMCNRRMLDLDPGFHFILCLTASEQQLGLKATKMIYL